MQHLTNDPLHSKITRPSDGPKITTYSTIDHSKQQTQPKQPTNTTLYTRLPLNYNYGTDNRKILESSAVVNTNVTNPLKISSSTSGEFYKPYSSNVTTPASTYTSNNPVEKNKYNPTTENKPIQTSYTGLSSSFYTPSYTSSTKTYSQQPNLSINTSPNVRSAYIPGTYTPTSSSVTKSVDNASVIKADLSKTTRYSSSKQSYSIGIPSTYSQLGTNNITNPSGKTVQTTVSHLATEVGTPKNEPVTRSYSYNYYSQPKTVQKTDNAQPLHGNKTLTAVVPTCNITLHSDLKTTKPAVTYTNPITATTQQSADSKSTIPRVTYDLRGAQKNTYNSPNPSASREERSLSYEPKYKPQSLNDINGVTPKPLYSPTTTTYSYHRHFNNSLTQPNNIQPNQQIRAHHVPSYEPKTQQGGSYQYKSYKPEDPTSVATNEGEIGEKINKMPTSPIALKRANSPNIREATLTHEHVVTTPSKSTHVYNDENESFKPPSRASPDRHSHHHRTPDSRGSHTEKPSALANTLSRPKHESFVSPGNPKISENSHKYQTAVKKSNTSSLNDVENASEGKRINFQSHTSTQNTGKISGSQEKNSAGPVGISKVDFSKVFSRTSSNAQSTPQGNNAEINGIDSLQKKGTGSHDTPLKSTDGRIEGTSLPNNSRAINDLSSKYVKTQKVDLIVSPPSKLTSNERSTHSGTVRTEEDLPSTRAAQFKLVDLRSQHMETETSGKKEPKNNHKPLAITFLKNIFNRKSGDPSRYKCTCDGYLKAGETCKRARKWILRRYKESEFDYLEETYQQILQHDLEDESCTKQIKKDLFRTYPKSKYYGEDGEGIECLERILNAFAKYDPQIGYVQGMNFIAASLLYHAEEYVAFWLLVFVVENFEMRDIFLPKLPGLTKHCQIIDILAASHLPAVYELLCKNEIRMEMFCSEWIFSLFAGVVPLDVMGQFYDRLLEQGWPFFYKVILAFLQHFQTELLEQNDFTELMMILKSQNHLINGFTEDKRKLMDWNKLFKQALKIEVDSNFIYSMHSNFDVEKQSFKTNFLTEDGTQKK